MTITHLRFCVALIATSLLLSFLSRSAIAQKGQTSMGTDFWIGFMPNSFYLGCCPPENCELFICSSTANEVHVDVYGGSSSMPVESYQMTLAANSTWTIPARDEASWEDDSCERPVTKGIHVYAQNPIAVYGYQYTGANTSSSDSYLAMPIPALGTEYYTSCYYDDHYSLGPSNPLAGQFLIVSPYDSTIVTIGPVKTDTRAEAQPQTSAEVTIAHNSGDTWNVMLMKGQTYLVQSTGLNYGDADLTGTHILSTKPIGLLSGHQLCSIPIGELAQQNGSKDEIMEMIPPLNEWGSEYFDMPTATRSICGDLVRVIAGDSDETITAMNGNGNPTEMLLRPGDFYDFDQITTPTVFSSLGGKKFLAVQMAYSQNYLGDTGKADPFSCILPAARQFQKLMMFQPPNRAGVGGFVHYATFICPEDSITHIQVNGKPISFYTSAGRSVFPGTNPLVGAYRILLDPSLCYVAKGPVPFGCYLDGWSIYESYGHPASLSLGINSSDILPPLEWQTSTCGTFHVILQDLQPPQFKQFGSRIADVALITDLGDLRWPTPSTNFALSFDSPFTPGDSVAHLTLSVVDPSQNAYAALWTTDRAGNDTVYQYTYNASTLTPNSNGVFSFNNIPIGKDTCAHIVFRNTSQAPFHVIGVGLLGNDPSNELSISPTIQNKTIAPGDSLVFQLCYSAADTGLVEDSITVSSTCVEFRYPVEASAITPIIFAGDLNFGAVTIGDTLCKSLVIHNRGTAPLIVFPNSLLTDTQDFTFSVSNLSDTILPGTEKQLELCFHPRTTAPITGVLLWSTNVEGKYAHRLKDTSVLTGVGVASGVATSSQPAPVLSIRPNPASGIATVTLVGAPATTVEVFDVLGRQVARFRVAGNYAWNMGNLPTGTYIIRASMDGVTLSKRVVKQ